MSMGSFQFTSFLSQGVIFCLITSTTQLCLKFLIDRLTRPKDKERLQEHRIETALQSPDLLIKLNYHQLVTT